MQDIYQVRSDGGAIDHFETLQDALDFCDSKGIRRVDKISFTARNPFDQSYERHILRPKTRFIKWSNKEERFLCRMSMNYGFTNENDNQTYFWVDLPLDTEVRNICSDYIRLYKHFKKTFSNYHPNENFEDYCDDYIEIDQFNEQYLLDTNEAYNIRAVYTNNQLRQLAQNMLEHM